MITGDSHGSGAGIQIMGPGMGNAEGVEIMGFGTITSSSLQGFGADPVTSPMMPAPPNYVYNHTKGTPGSATAEMIGAAAVLLLLAGGVAYALHKK